MKKIAKPLLIICICAICILIIFTTLITVQNQTLYEKEAEDKLYYANKSYANEFNQIFIDIETLVHSLAVDVSLMFTYDDYKDDMNKLQKNKMNINNVIVKMLENNKNATGLFLSINPEIHKGRHEVYVIKNDEQKVVPIDTETLSPTWFLEDNPIVAWYYAAVKDGEHWSGLAWESALEKYVTTYATSVYDENNVLIGVAGADIFMSEVTKTVENMNIYENGKTYLTDSNFDLIAQNVDDEIPANILSKIKSLEGANKNVFYVNKDDTIVSFSQLQNGWYLIMMQPETAVYESLNNYRVLSFALAIFAILILVLIIIYVFKRTVFPIYKELEDQEIYVIHKNRQAELGSMIANIAHQWKQPLNAINISLLNIYEDLKQPTIEKEEINEHLARIQTCVDSLSPTLDDFVNYLQPIEKQEEFDPKDEIERAIRLIGEGLKISQIKCEVYEKNPVLIKGYRNEFCQCILNLINNAAEAVKEDKTIFIEISKEEYTYISITNTSDDIPKEVEKRLFEPYFTTKENNGGAGIGLYLTERIIVEHFNGKIEFEYKNGQVTFTIKIPVF